MNILAFVTTNVFDALPRILDHARKSNFALMDLRVTQQHHGVYQVQAAFGPAGALSFATLVELCGRIVDVEMLTLTWPESTDLAGKVAPCVRH